MATTDSLMSFSATAGVPGDADYATLDVLLTTSADEPDNMIPVLDFDSGATEEYIYFQGVMPSHYDGGGITVTIGWTATATSGNVDWGLAWKRLPDTTNVLSTAFAAPNLAGVLTVDGTARDLNISTITFTDGADMDSVVADDYFWLELHRNTSVDTMSGDAEFHYMLIKET